MTHPVPASLRTLLANTIDFAGMYPPAQLSFEDSVKRAATFRREARLPWLFAKVVFSMDCLKQIQAELLHQSGADGSPWFFAALGKGTLESLPEEFARSVEWELREIRHLNQRGGQGSIRFEVRAYETKLPTGLLDSQDGLRSQLEILWERWLQTDLHQVEPFFEVSLAQDWRGRLERVTEVLELAQESSPVPLGVKFRTGGAEKLSPEQLSAAIEAAVQSGLRFKATQGLHHPFTSPTDYGFINLFSALALAQAMGPSDFPRESIERCLLDSNSKSFVFEEDTFRWTTYALPTSNIEAARRTHGGSFGSCSLDEPDQFLTEELG